VVVVVAVAVAVVRWWLRYQQNIPFSNIVLSYIRRNLV
jgi:hypothetical protein